jgi:stage II sporulation protein AB (anti-sigma F factor)
MERSGMGFTVMETFMDSIEIFSERGIGTTVKMTKSFSNV